MLGRQIIVECRFNVDVRRMAMAIKIKEMIERGPNHLTSGKFTTISLSKESCLTPNTITDIA